MEQMGPLTFFFFLTCSFLIFPPWVPTSAEYLRTNKPAPQGTDVWWGGCQLLQLLVPRPLNCP